MTTIAPQAYRMILAAADNLIHLARLHGVLPTLETEPRQPLAMGNHFLRLTLRPVRNPEPAAADNCRRPDLLEKLAYHEGARCDMSLEDCLSFLANGWKETPSRSYTQLVLQLTELLAAVPFRPYCNDDCRARTNGIEAELQALRKKVATYEARDALGLLPKLDTTLPMQPIEIAADGVVRFRKNSLVAEIATYSEGSMRVVYGMAQGKYTAEEQMQLAQLCGYSVSGYGDLDYASKDSIARADAIAAALLARGAA